MRLVRYTYEHPTIGVQDIVLAQEGPADHDWIDPVGVEATFRAGSFGLGAWYLDDEATRIVHKVLNRQVVGRVAWVGVE